jgi:hypothetical protein
VATIDEDLSQLEKDVRQLKIEYEQYFGGGRKRPPADIQWRIDMCLKKYGERGANMNFSQRYKYGGIAQTYARYRDFFRKRLQQWEEGTVTRHFGAAAKAIEAERVAKHAGEKRAKKSAGERTTVEIACVNPDREFEEGNKLFHAFRDAKSRMGEDTSRLTKGGFQEFLTKKASELRAKTGDDRVEFLVMVQGGHVKLKARLQNTVPAKR